MRRPYRERLGIILNELGAGVGGRATDIQETVRRAVPALRETDRVLAILAEQNQVLGNLTRDADAVIGDLADNRKDVGRFVTETRQTASASAERRAEIAASLRRLPDLPRRARADDGPARPGGRRADAGARRPQPVRRPARDASSSSCPLRRRPAAPASSRSPSCREDGRPAAAGREAHDRRAQQGLDRHAGARQQPRDRPRAPRRPRPRGREGPALARRQGLHRLRGAPPVRLRPDDGDQHLRLQRLHAEGEPLPVRVLGLPEPRLAEGEAAGGPGLLPALRRHPRPAPARASRSPTRPTPARRRAPSTTCRPPRRTTRRRPPRPRSRRIPRTPSPPTRRRSAPRSWPSGSRRRSASSCPSCPPVPRSPPCRSRSRACPAASSPPAHDAGAPRLPARAMKRASAAANPVLIGAVTSSSRPSPSSWPTTPTTACRSCRPRRVKVRVANGANLVKGNEVRSGGSRIGVVDRHAAGAARGRLDRRRADARAREGARRPAARLDAADPAALGARPQVRRGREGHERGRASAAATPCRPRRRPSPTELDEVYEMFDEPTRKAAQENLRGFGDAFAGRGAVGRPHARGAAARSCARSSR